MKRNLKTYNIILKNATANEIKNGKWPKRYRSEFIEPGLCSYIDLGMGVIYIGADTLDKMNPTFIGKPVLNVSHQDITAEQAYKLSNEDIEAMADGVVYEVGKLDNGWYYCDMIIWNEETQNNIENGYSVSCAYIVEEVGPGGKYHELEYDEEILDGVYTHNCITNTPRYESAKVYELPLTYTNKRVETIYKIFQNCKGEYDMKKSVFKHFLNSKAKKENACGTAPPKDEKENTVHNMEGAMIEVEGEKIPLEDAVNAYKARMENQPEEETSKTLGPEDVVEVDGEQVKVGDLIQAYKGTMQNAEPPQDEEAEEVVEEQQSMSNTAPNKPKEKSKNYFKIVKNACAETQEQKIYVNTIDERFKRGKNRYGTKEVVK
jgi:hypothetical protein